MGEIIIKEEFGQARCRVFSGLILALLLIVNVSCSAGTEKEVARDNESILTQRALAVFASTPGEDDEFPNNLITAAELNSRLQDQALAVELFLLDTRRKHEWVNEGHIDGAVSMIFQEIAEPGNLDILPFDKTIVCVSSTGHTAVQAASVLRLLGYNTVVLEHGMAGWMPTQAGKMMLADVRNGMARKYPVLKGEESVMVVETVKAAPGPAAPSPEDFVLLAAAANAMMNNNVYDKRYPFNHIFADDLFKRSQDPVGKGSIFLLDIRPASSWGGVGHIEGAQHIAWRDLGQRENIIRLPKDKLIVVLGDTGQTAGQVTPILRILGYDAVTLRSGMTAWTETPDSKRTLRLIGETVYSYVKQP